MKVKKKLKPYDPKFRYDYLGIHPEMFKYFGKEIEVYLVNNDYVYYSGHGWSWNVKWFEPDSKDKYKKQGGNI